MIVSRSIVEEHNHYLEKLFESSIKIDSLFGGSFSYYRSRSIRRLEKLSESSITIDSSFGEAFRIIDHDRFVVWKSFSNRWSRSIHHLKKLFELSITIDSSFGEVFRIIDHDRFVVWRSFRNHWSRLIYYLKKLSKCTSLFFLINFGERIGGDRHIESDKLSGVVNPIDETIFKITPLSIVGYVEMR